MGCGRSTMGSDSPSRNSKQGDDEEICENETPRQKSLQQNSIHGPAIPFNHGGPLLAQAKISDSQLDFFKDLDEKIENGPDYDSEREDILEKSHLRKCLEKWNQLTEARQNEPQQPDDSIPLINSTDNSCSGKVDATEEDEETDFSDPKEVLHGAIKEQYMFMGNLYTLTRLRSDGSYAPQVDVSPAHKIEDIYDDTVTPILGGVVVNKPDEKEIVKLNGSYPKGEERIRRLERADTPIHNPVSKGRVPPRPASLVLRTVFPNPEEA